MYERGKQDLPRTNSSCEGWHCGFSSNLPVQPTLPPLAAKLQREQHKPSTDTEHHQREERSAEQYNVKYHIMLYDITWYDAIYNRIISLSYKQYHLSLPSTFSQVSNDLLYTISRFQHHSEGEASPSTSSRADFGPTGLETAEPDETESEVVLRRVPGSSHKGSLLQAMSFVVSDVDVMISRRIDLFVCWRNGFVVFSFRQFD